MKRIELGQGVQILANIGVIAGIIFLGLEVQQNNDFLDSQARQNRANGARELNAAIYNDETGLGQIIAKARLGEQLTDYEAFRLDRYLATVILSWEYWYQDFADGIIGAEELRYGGWDDLYYDVLPEKMTETWNRVKPDSHPEFVEFMEENVVNR